MKKTVSIIGILVAFTLCLSTMASAGQGGTDQVERNPMATETGLGPAPFFNYQGPGADFIKAGVTTRVYFTLPLAPQTEPFELTVPALPSGAVVIETFISWNYLLNGPPPATDVITIDLIPVTGTLVGTGTPDLCWKHDNDATASYMASGVTPLINPGPAPVTVTIAGATDKPLGADSIAFGEGLTILVVYEVPGYLLRNVDLYRGFTSTESGPVPLIAEATLNYTVPYEGGDFHFFVNALDGEERYGDKFLIDGISRGGQVSGTVATNNAWHGLLGAVQPSTNNVYDHANDDDISRFLLTPDISLNISTDKTGGGDCVGHSFAAVSFPLGYVPEHIKMHWPQLPDLDSTGMDVSIPNPLADDWECTETGPVTDIHFWASFKGDSLPDEGVGSLMFLLSIHGNDPGPPSTPGAPLWFGWFDPGEYQVYQVADNNPEDWYKPLTGTWLDDNHVQAYRYDFLIDHDFFVQDSGTIYWLEVGLINVPPMHPFFGWKTTEPDLHFMDDACYWDYDLQNWIPMFYPPGHEYEYETIDLAFAITGRPVLDFGDAPDPTYPTQLPSGARHTVVPGVFMGNFIDSEDDGQQTADALGDDITGVDDEDGVVFTTLLMPGQPAEVKITAATNGHLDAWVDFNADGDWIDPDENIFAGEWLWVGHNTLQFNVPASTPVGITYSRFRFSLAGGLGYSGLAPNGEVEDHEVTIVEPIEDIKMHWPQWPDLDSTGMDVAFPHTHFSNEWFPLADDWKCTETGPVTDIHFWGSFMDDDLPAGGVGRLSFILSIHDNIPGPPSMPGAVLWTQTFPLFSYDVHQVADDNPEDWYDPMMGEWLDNNHHQAYQYDFFIDHDFFVQDSETVYWLEVEVWDLFPSTYRFGWKTTEHDLHFMDDAVYWDYDVQNWIPMFYPPEHEYEYETLDLAFVITSEPMPGPVGWVVTVGSPADWLHSHIKVSGKQNRTIRFMLFSIGDEDLIYSVSSDHPCIQVSVPPTSLAPGASVEIPVLLDGTGACNGTFIAGNVILTTNEDGGKVELLQVHAVVDDDYYECPRDPETVDTLENDYIRMYVNANCQQWIHDIGYEPDSTHEVFFNGGTIVATTKDADTLVGRFMGDNDWCAGAQDKLYKEQCEPDWEPHFWILFTKEIYIQASHLPPPNHFKWFWWEIAKQIKFFKSSAPPEYQRLVIKYVKIKRQDPPGWWPDLTPFTDYEDTYIGFAMDLNAPFDTAGPGTGNESGLNYGRYDAVNHIAYVKGFGREHPEYNDYCAGIALAEVDGVPTIEAYGTDNIKSNQFLYPQSPWGWLDGELYGLCAATTPKHYIQDGPPAPDSIVDRTIVMTAKMIPAGTDENAKAEFAIVEVLAPTGEAQMQALVDTARAIVARERALGGLPAACGDVQGDFIVNIGDVVHLVCYLYKSGPEPKCPTARGDVNSDGIINIGDVVYLVTYLYKSGPPPECPGIWAW